MATETASFPRGRETADAPDPIDVHVGARLRLRRHLVGMSQERLGKATDITFQQVQKYERGTNRMGASRLFRIAQALGVPVSYFFEEMAPGLAALAGGGFGEAAQAPLHDLPTPHENETLGRRETLELIRAYYRIRDPHQRRKVYELVRAMADAGGEGTS